MKDIIAKLEQQRNAIERALSALRGIEAPREGKQASAPAPEQEAAPAAKARKRARKGRLTPEGRERLAEAMKRRWAIKRSAAQAKKSARKS